MIRLAAIILFALSAITLAAESTTAPATKPAAGERTLQGMVQSVQKNTLTISILKKKGELKEHKVRVRKGTTVTLNGSPVALSDLKAGENVTIHMARGSVTDIAATSK